MNGKKLLGIVILLTLWVAQAFSAPIDHVFVSSNKLDKINLDGSLDMPFLPGSTDGVCQQITVNGDSGDVWLGCLTPIQ